MSALNQPSTETGRQEVDTMSQEMLRHLLLTACIEVIEKKLRKAATLVEETALKLSAEFRGLTEAIDMQQRYMASIDTIVQASSDTATRHAVVEITTEHMQVMQRIHEHIGAMVMDMQFQDRNSQYIENACEILEELAPLYGDTGSFSIDKGAAPYCRTILERVRLQEFREPLLEMFQAHGLADDTLTQDYAKGDDPSDDSDDIELF